MLATIRLRTTVLAAALSFVPFVAAEAAPPLLQHRAIYDLSLERKSGGTGVSSLNGRLVIETTGSACVGYTVNFRLVSQFADGDGRSTTSDLRSLTHEGGNGDEFRFVTKNYVNDKLSEESDGLARRNGSEGIAVTLTKPEDKNVHIEQKVLFPTEHLTRLIAAAERGDTLVRADVFDGSESGEKIYTTSAIIGREGIGDTEPVEGIEGVRHWPVTVSYYEGRKPGEQVPVYELSFDLFANGVSGNLMLDYGEFSVRGKLTALEVLGSPITCNP